MNRKTAFFAQLARRQRNRRIKIVLLAIALGGLMGWALTYSQEQAFSLTPADPDESLGTSIEAIDETVSRERE